MLVNHFVEERRAGNRHLSFGVRPWCNVPAAVFNTKPAPRVTQRRRICALCVRGGGAARKLSTRARRGALFVLGRRFVEGRRAGERHLPFGVRPWYDVPAAACNAKPAQCATRRTVSREEAQHLSSSLARAVSRRFWSSQLRGKTLRRQEASLLRHAPVVRRANCGLQHYANTACQSAHAHLHFLSLGRRRSSRGCYARKRAVARLLCSEVPS